jgi:hypothetical protein
MILLDIEDSCKFCILDFEDYIENNNKTKYLQLYSNFNEVYFYNSLLIFLHLHPHNLYLLIDFQAIVLIYPGFLFLIEIAIDY